MSDNVHWAVLELTRIEMLHTLRCVSSGTVCTARSSAIIAGQGLKAVVPVDLESMSNRVDVLCILDC